MRWILFFLLFSNTLLSQQKIGLEIRAGLFQNYNAASFIGNNSYGLSYANFTKEENVITHSYGVALSYQPIECLMLMFRIAQHQNGRVLDATLGFEAASDDFVGIDWPYKYLQYQPSVAYVFSHDKLRFPLEFGFGINKLLNEGDVLMGLERYNYDLSFHTGFDYEVLADFLIGIRLGYVHGLGDYTTAETTSSYEPRQIGLQLSASYLLSFPKKSEKLDEEN